ncbi:hypothetical protein B0H10DRAFT_1207793 [Mycena sp. CBHHK59/15]|nr:hypothetical protein B0H10DRAFT_1207793 [Mycena sp. CBHHK59/15]
MSGVSLGSSLAQQSSAGSRPLSNSLTVALAAIVRSGRRMHECQAVSAISFGDTIATMPFLGREICPELAKSHIDCLVLSSCHSHDRHDIGAGHHQASGVGPAKRSGSGAVASNAQGSNSLLIIGLADGLPSLGVCSTSNFGTSQEEMGDGACLACPLFRCAWGVRLRRAAGFDTNSGPTRVLHCQELPNWAPGGAATLL